VIGRVLRLRPPWLPRATVRLRLTALFGMLFLIAGGALLGSVYLSAASGRFLTVSTGGAPITGHARAHGLPPLGAVRTAHGAGAPRMVIDLHNLLILSLIALAIMAVISVGLGWLFSGRALRRLRTVTRAARTISATNLHSRLALDGPDDELKQLGDTFDELLARLERSFVAQRQFVANASHELRTPLARQRTLIEIALTDPGATVESLQANNRRLLAAGEQQERLVEALLALARSEQGLDRREAVDLATVVHDVLAGYPRAEPRPQFNATLAQGGRVPIEGDRRLLERLIENLLDNAVRYNVPDGRVDIQTRIDATAGPRRAVLRIANTGPIVPAQDIERLLMPFQRLDGDRRAHGDGDGVGLGLSIVRAVATAHDARLSVRARPRGGLVVEVRFPSAVTDPQPIVHHPEGTLCSCEDRAPEGGGRETAPGRRPPEARDDRSRRSASPGGRGRPRVRRR
jgi:signal transduction histidine kinase